MHDGSGVLGLLFHAFGPKTILFCYFVASVIVLICLLANISFAKSIEDYERFPADKDGEDSDWKLVEKLYKECLVWFKGSLSVCLPLYDMVVSIKGVHLIRLNGFQAENYSMFEIQIWSEIFVSESDPVRDR